MVATLLALLIATVVTCAPVQRSVNASCEATNLIPQLRNALTGANRMKLLIDCGTKSLVFDYNNPPNTATQKSNGGKQVSAKETTFPALSGIPQTLTMITLEPCGMLPPHVHPRGSEFVFVLEGNLTTQFFPESGAPVVTNQLSPYTATVFPQGSIHANFNPSCNETKFITSFPTSDAGIEQAAGLFEFNDELVTSALGGEAIFSEKELAAVRTRPKIVGQFSSEECLQKCGLKSGTT
jgi:hypothetical protein